MKTIKDLSRTAETFGWTLTLDDNMPPTQTFLLSKTSPCGQDFNAYLMTTNYDAETLCDSLRQYIDNFDVSYETYLWLDTSGHGMNGAPYDMRDLYDDMESCKEMMQELLAEWRTALANV